MQTDQHAGLAAALDETRDEVRTLRAENAELRAHLATVVAGLRCFAHVIQGLDLPLGESD